MKTALVTGCNRGLGKTILDAFVKKGYGVIALNRKEYVDFSDYVDSLKRDYNADIKMVYADFRNEHSLNTALDAIEQMEIPIDVLVNNAGINNSTKPIFNTEYSEVEECFRINYFAPFLITKRISSIMIHQSEGSIINISSTVSVNTDMAESCYGASKAALNLFTKSVAQELAPFNVRINALACGVMDTDMFRDFDEKVRKKALKRIALKRPANLDEVASAVLYLASDEAKYITGAILPIDGGFA
jgi:3-oxoacyl-[acyl-carrier protein] reductase